MNLLAIPGDLLLTAYGAKIYSFARKSARDGGGELDLLQLLAHLAMGVGALAHVSQGSPDRKQLEGAIDDMTRVHKLILARLGGSRDLVTSILSSDDLLGEEEKT